MKKIYVGNLSLEATERGISEAFTAFGAVQKVSIMRDRHSGEPRGFAFLEMESDEAAASAIAAFNGTQLEGQIVAVNEARSRGVKTGDPGASVGVASGATKVVSQAEVVGSL